MSDTLAAEVAELRARLEFLENAQTQPSPVASPTIKADEAAQLLGITRAALYARVARGLVPGAIRISRRALRFRRDAVLQLLAEGRAPSRERESRWA